MTTDDVSAAFADLADRLRKARAEVEKLALTSPVGSQRTARLAGKADGIGLALSYVEEAAWEAQREEAWDARQYEF